jgi:hypothetical protein
MESIANPAEQALQLLFKKLEPHLEDAAHALAAGADAATLEKLHGKLERACATASEVLDGLAEGCPEDLAERLGTLSANLLPVGANYRQLLTLVQLCLEQAPADLLPFAAAGSAAGSSWGRRMAGFLARLEESDFQAERRWRGVDPEIGDEARFY